MTDRVTISRTTLLKGIGAWLLWPLIVQWLLARRTSGRWPITIAGLVLTFAPALLQALRSPRTRDARGTVAAIFLAAGALGVLAIEVIFHAWGSPGDAQFLALALLYLFLPPVVALTAAAGLIMLRRERARVPVDGAPAARFVPIGVMMALAWCAATASIAWLAHP